MVDRTFGTLRFNAANAAAILASASEAGTIRRMAVRQQLWEQQRQREQRELEAANGGQASSKCSSSGGGGGSAVVSSSRVHVNSWLHQRNIEEVFNRWTTFITIASFL